MKKLIFYFIISFVFIQPVYSQESKVDEQPNFFNSLSISGNYRFFAQQRYFIDPYILGVNNNDTSRLIDRSILIGDATQLPELTLNIGATPSKNASFGTDITIWNQNTGNFEYFRGMNLGVNLYGSFKTSLGNFDVKTGGIHWLMLSRLTFKPFEGYNRYSLFERNPWDPQFNLLIKRYADYYDRGAVVQDERWGRQAFQGFALDGGGLPYGLRFTFLYGKAQTNVSSFKTIDNTNYQQSIQFANTQFYSSLLPSYIIAGRVVKDAKFGSFGLNSLSGYSYADSLAYETDNYFLHSLNYNIKLKRINLIGELGISKYNDLNSDIVAVAKIQTDKSLTYLPIDIEYFYVGRNVYNKNSEIINTSINDNPIDPAEGGVLQQNGSAMLGVGQLANNRTGVSFNTEFEIRKFKFNFGQTISKELERLTSNLTYGRTINSVTFSEFYRWQYLNNIGPYGRISKVFRGVYETVSLDNREEGVIAFDKHFNSVDLQAKYKYTVFQQNKSYLFYLGSFKSAQKKFSPMVVFNEDAYIRHYSHQLENYLGINKRLTFTNYLGVERVIGNYETDISDITFMPRNQTVLGVGIGFDYLLSKSTAIYVKHRYFSFEDKNFVLDNTNGHETTVELKVNF